MVCSFSCPRDFQLEAKPMKIVIVQVQVHNAPCSKCFRAWDKLGHNWSSLDNTFSAYFSFLIYNNCFQFYIFHGVSVFYLSNLIDPHTHTSVPNSAVRWLLMSHKMLEKGYEVLFKAQCWEPCHNISSNHVNWTPGSITYSLHNLFIWAI